MDPMSELTELLEPERQLVARLRDQLRRGRRVLGEPRPRDAKPERERDQPLLCTVVEVPLEPPPLGVAGLDDARTRRRQLLTGLGVRERDRYEARELLEPLLDAGWKSAEAAADRDQGSAPEPPRHHDRSGHSRTHAGGEHALSKVGRLRLRVDPHRYTSLRDARDRAAFERKPNAERRFEVADPLPGSHDHRLVRAVDVAHGRSGVGAEQPADLLRDQAEEPLGALLGRNGDGDAAEGGLLVGQRRELLTGLRIRDRDGDQAGELPEPLLGVGRKPEVARDRDGERAPDLARYDDRGGDDGRDAERKQALVELGGHARVVRGHPSRRAGSRNLGEQGALLDHDDRAGAGDLHTRLAPLADDDPLVRSRPETHEVRRVCADEAGDLLGDDVEDPLGSRLGRDGHRDALQRRLLLDQRAEVRRGHEGHRRTGPSAPPGAGSRTRWSI